MRASSRLKMILPRHIRAELRTALALSAILILGLFLVACGSSNGSEIDPGNAADAPSYKEALAAAPPKLSKLYAAGDELFPGDAEVFVEQLADLRGYPVVVNNWASWCGPCREEFPYLQSQAAEHLDEVAFLGVDSQDSDEAATTFLETHPVPYPSITDPDGEFSDWVDTGLVGIPNTLFFDRTGALVFVKQGPFTDEAELAADIEKYALSD
jgi:cytochrome c biogenesis protein CcmG/thiol:disulfide interchange protein DsbE